MTISTHPGRSRLSVETINRTDAAWLVLQGEADIATLEELEAALTRVQLSGVKSVHLHLADLDFADVSTLCQLTDFARRARESGRDIRTCGARPIVRKLAHLLSFQDDLGLS